MERTKLTLTTLFLATHVICQDKTGISALAPRRDLGLNYSIAWLVHHKINNAMARLQAVIQLIDAVQLDDASLGGERYGGKEG
jgi:hypothetical protein